MDWSLCSAVDRDPEKVGGAWCFRGTRLPVASLFDHIAQGSTIDEFAEWFPSVSKEQVHEVLDFARGSLQQATEIAVERLRMPLDRATSPEAVLRTIRALPHPTSAAVDDLEAAVAVSRLEGHIPSQGPRKANLPPMNADKR